VLEGESRYQTIVLSPKIATWMDGKGHREKRLFERLWRSIECEKVTSTTCHSRCGAEAPATDVATSK